MAIPLTARAPVPFTPPSTRKTIAAENAERLKRGEDPREPVQIMVRVPTMFERDNFAAALVRGGVVHYSRDQVRDLMLAGVAFLRPDKFDEIRGDLEQLWQAADALQKCKLERTDRLVELMEHQAELPEGKKLTDAQLNAELEKIQPEVALSEEDRVRVTALQQDITSRYSPLQKAFADLAEQDTKRSWLCVEIYTVTWTGLDLEPTGNGQGGLLRHESEWLRAQIGSEAFDELGEFIFAMHSIDKDEEKNLASLIESYSDQTGSKEDQSKESTVSDAGNSTDENSSATPAGGSRKMTARSSGSSTPAAKKTGRSKSTQTADR